MTKFAFMLAWVFSSLVAGATEPFVIGESLNFQSQVLNETISYGVALPASYSWASDRNYPVLFVLDGYKHFAHSTTSVNFLATQNEIPEMIVVGLSSNNRIRDFTQSDWPEAWNGGGGASHFIRFLESEFLPLIDRTYRTNNFRVLSGSSASGQFVIHLLGSNAKLFQSYFAFAPALDWDNNLPQRELESFLKQRAELPVYLYIANSNDTGIFLADFQKVIQTLSTNAPRRFRWHAQAFPLETHTSVPLVALIDALRKLYTGYRFQDLHDQGFEYAEQHFLDVSTMIGTNIPVPEHVINDFAYISMSEGNIDKAIDLFRQNSTKNPNSASAFNHLSEAYTRANRTEEATKALAKALSLKKKNQKANR